MKKILIGAFVAFFAVAANAAATNWKITGGNIKGTDLTSAYAGAVQIWATGGDLIDSIILDTRDISGGFGSAYTFSTEALTAGETYDIFFVLTDTKDSIEYTLTSATVSKTAVSVGTATVGFGNLGTYTGTASNWVAVPEPTSGILLLLGMAGLALRRKQK